MKTIRRSALLGLAALVPLLSGCFDIEQSMRLEKDLSGTAGFQMTVNFEPMALMMLRMQREMAGVKGDPTPAEIEKAKADFLASKKDKSPADDFKAKRAEFEKSLPPGVQLLDGGAEDEGLKMRVHTRFRFDNVAKLGQIHFSPPQAAQGGSGMAGGPGAPKNPYDSPFNGLQVVDEGKTVLLTSATVDPLKDPAAQPGSASPITPEIRQQMAEAFQGMRVVFKLETPMTVVESNATRRDGPTLYWEYDLATMEKMTPEQARMGIRVRLRK
jgi:hypothetical protein